MRIFLALIFAGTLFAQDPVILKDAAGTNGASVSAGGALKVDGSGVTQPVSAASLPLPSGAATAAKQPALGTAGSASTDVLSVQGIASMTALKTDGSAVTQPVSAAALPLPSGASTAAKQPALGTAGSASTDVITIQGIASMTKLLVTPDSVALPANQSVNVNQLAGTTTDTNSGTKSAGTLRVVIATDQPQLTNKLLVTPDANSAINNAQVAGSTIATSATGVQKVGVVGNAGAAFDAATGAAPPANGLLLAGLTSGATGGLLTAIPVCDSQFNVNISTATTTLAITGVSGRHARVCSFDLVTNAANNVAIISGTGATCGTGSAAIVGTTSGTGYNLSANGGLTRGGGLGMIFRTVATGDSICIITSAGTQLSGVLTYAIY